MRLYVGVAVFGMVVATANASFVVNAVQQGGNVVLEGSGTLNVSGLTDQGSTVSGSGVVPVVGAFGLGPGNSTPVEEYGSINGPSSFGNGGFAFASSGTGEQLTVQGGSVFVPFGYVSGTAITDSATFDNATFASLGLAPGTYTWTWGSGADADSLTLNIPNASTPEPASIALLVGFAGLLGFRLKRRGA